MFAFRFIRSIFGRMRTKGITGWLLHYIKQPMVAVYLSDGVGGPVRKNVVKILDFFLPIAVGTGLAFRKHERFPRIKASINGGKIGVIGGDFQNPRQTKKVESCTASFED